VLQLSETFVSLQYNNQQGDFSYSQYHGELRKLALGLIELYKFIDIQRFILTHIVDVSATAAAFIKTTIRQMSPRRTASSRKLTPSG